MAKPKRAKKGGAKKGRAKKGRAKKGAAPKRHAKKGGAKKGAARRSHRKPSRAALLRAGRAMDAARMGNYARAIREADEAKAIREVMALDAASRRLTPSARGRKKGARAKLLRAARRGASKGGHKFRAITGPRATTWNGVPALMVKNKGSIKGFDLQTGDRITVRRLVKVGGKYVSKAVLVESFGGVRPRGNPDKKRRRTGASGAKRRITFRTKHGVVSFGARKR